MKPDSITYLVVNIKIYTIWISIRIYDKYEDIWMVQFYYLKR